MAELNELLKKDEIKKSTQYELISIVNVRKIRTETSLEQLTRIELAS